MPKVCYFRFRSRQRHTCEIRIAFRTQSQLRFVHDAAVVVKLQQFWFLRFHNASIWLAVSQPEAGHPHVFNRIVHIIGKSPVPDANFSVPLQPRVDPFKYKQHLRSANILYIRVAYGTSTYCISGYFRGYEIFAVSWN